jgi:L,D-peptidoglycan transpeptidase YkuD (ErfK/YbiS/YcfS/YnhG family)
MIEDDLIFIRNTGPSRAILTYKDMRFDCALGKGGIVASKIEGDGATPIGSFALRRVFYRKDKIAKPQTVLKSVAITEDMGWCDDPFHDSYNQLVKLPFATSHEKLWREDNLYNIVVELGYNDDPVIKNKGSAVFMHVARENYAPTEGCIALSELDLISLLSRMIISTKVIVS